MTSQIALKRYPVFEIIYFIFLIGFFDYFINNFFHNFDTFGGLVDDHVM